MSEQIFTLPLITSAAGTGTLEAFDNWCQSCSNSILKFCHHGIAQVLPSAFPDMGYEVRVLAVENEAAGKAHIWPLFLVIEPVIDGVP